MNSAGDRGTRRHAVPYLIVTALLIFFATGVQAAPLSLEEAVQTALAHSPEIKAVDQDIAVTRTKLDQVRAQQRLQVNADVSLIHLQEVPTLEVPPITIPLPAQLGGPQTLALPAFVLSESNIFRTTVSLQQPLTTSGRIKYSLAQVNEAIAALEARAEARRREVALNVVRAYLAAVLAQRVAAVTEEAYATVLQHQTQAEAVVRAGMAPRYELVRAQTEVANQDRRRLDAHNQADLAVAYLQDLLGVTSEEPPALTTPLAGNAPLTVELPSAMTAAEAASADLRALAARDRLFQAAEQAARAEKKPILAAVASTELYSADLPLTTPAGFVGVVAHLPLEDGGLANAKVREQAALRERNGSDIARLQSGIRLEVRKYYLDLTSARKALEAADKAVELAQENLRLATRRFAVGEGTGIEKMDAILALSIAETNREQARYQYDLAYYGLRKAMGTILTAFAPQEHQP